MRSILLITFLSILLTACGGGGGGTTNTGGGTAGTDNTNTGTDNPITDTDDATDETPTNTDDVTETLPKVVFENGAADDAWNELGAYDEANPQWGNCINDGGQGCPSISWSIVNDNDRGNVLEISHGTTNKEAAVFIQTSSAYDLSAYAGGTIDFDVKIMSGDNKLTMKIDCVWPCTSGEYSLGAVEGSDWKSLSVNVNDLVAQGLSLLTVNTGIVIRATDHNATVFRLDNVRWTANSTGPTTGGGNTGGTISDWVKADKNIGYTTPAEYAGYTKVWSEEFDGASINTDNWTFETGTTDAFGNVDWGNNELQYYREENAYLEDGLLVIEAKKETFGGRAYTSSRMKTMDKFSFQYGRVDIRAAVAEGKGLWSALWMMGQNWSEEGWPYCGELDIVDTIGGPGNEETIINKAFWNNGGIGSAYDVASHGTEYDLAGGETFSGTFHVFSLVWTENAITWYVDDVESHSLNIDNEDLREAFQQQFFLIFNVAVGGDWPGDPVTATNFPRGMLVDYVRVFQPED